MSTREESYAVEDEFEMEASYAANPSSPTPKEKPPMACYQRFLKELNPCQDWFNVQDVNGRKIDIPECFAPATCRAFILKLCGTGLAVGIYIYAFIDSSAPEFLLAYLTYWALTFVCLYFCISLFNTIMSERTPQPPDRVGCRIRTTWVLFELAAHFELLVVLMYWSLIYEGGEPGFLSIMVHGVICAVTWGNGLFVDHIPVRWMHWYGFILTFNILFIVWTLLQNYLDVGNPDKSDNDPDTNDDLLYDAIDWKDDTGTTIMWALIVVLVISPLVYTLLWVLSAYTLGLCCCSTNDRRRYIDSFKDDVNDNRPTVNDVEEGSIFARFW